MSSLKTDLPNISWEARPLGREDVIWRYSRNPVVPRDLIPFVTVENKASTRKIVSHLIEQHGRRFILLLVRLSLRKNRPLIFL